MAAEKKSLPAKSKSKAQPAAKKLVKNSPPPAKAAKAAKPATPSRPVKPAKTAAPSKPAKAKPARAAAPTKPTKATAAKALEPARATLDVGSAAPSFELSDEKGKLVSSSSLAGKPYLLYFYPKDDTPGCTKEACDIRDNFGRFGKQSLRVLGVSPDSTQSHAKFGKKYGLPFSLLSDPDKTLANAYGVWGLKTNYGKEYMGIVRSSFLIGADGLVKKAYRGVKVPGHVDAVLADAQALL